MLTTQSAVGLVAGGGSGAQMADNIIRVRVISDYYGKAMKVNKAGDLLDLPPSLARELIASGKVELNLDPPKAAPKEKEAK